MNKWGAAVKADKTLWGAVTLSLLMLVALSYCLYQFSQVKKNADRLTALNRQMASLSLLQSRFPPDAVTASQLQERLQQSAQKNQITVTVLSENEEGVQVMLSAVPFERLMRWLAEMQREQGVRVVQLAVEHQEQGVVKVNQLLLKPLPAF